MDSETGLRLVNSASPKSASKIGAVTRCCASISIALEDRVKPALLRMKDGEGLTIGPDGQRALLHWLLKNAVVHEFVMPQGSPFRVSTAEQRRQVAAGVVSAGWRIAVAGYEGPGPNLAHTLSGVKQQIDDSGLPVGGIVLHTFRFECFVAQVLLHSLPEPPELAKLLGGPSTQWRSHIRSRSHGHRLPFSARSGWIPCSSSVRINLGHLRASNDWTPVVGSAAWIGADRVAISFSCLVKIVPSVYYLAGHWARLTAPRGPNATGLGDSEQQQGQPVRSVVDERERASRKRVWAVQGISARPSQVL